MQEIKEEKKEPSDGVWQQHKQRQKATSTFNNHSSEKNMAQSPPSRAGLMFDQATIPNLVLRHLYTKNGGSKTTELKDPGKRTVSINTRNDSLDSNGSIDSTGVAQLMSPNTNLN